LIAENKMGDFKIFIDIVLYLLLALAFFKSFLEGTAYLLFIFGILAILCLTLVEIIGVEGRSLGFIFIAPFILFFLFILTRMFYSAILPRQKWAKHNFRENLGKIVLQLSAWKSIWAILIILLILTFIMLSYNILILYG